ncbi:sugar phosphate isomerase/epimerase [Aquitalea palustris]|uniref:Sugar phosphate isomerase/epimerase n=1 Tax=Aquitalea palustris TaxID=2480983 RepID=A0A454JDM3_9NEIS|nr:TIM barrel protein [Aquitalea palustris]RMC91802.1 sugar phosphate isomerase/epimerase [Aquitalea palustris]
MPPRQLALAALSMLELSPPDMVSCAAAAGFSHVGLRLLPATAEEPQHDMLGNSPLLQETLQRLQDTGLQVSDVEILRLKAELDVASYLPMLESAARLGAREVLVAGNDPDFARCVDSFARLCQLAAPLGLSMNIEPMPWTDIRNIGMAMRLLEQAGQDNAALLVDAIHFDRAGDRPAALATVPCQRLHYMQLCDAPAAKPDSIEQLLYQARAERMPPGHGGLALGELLLALPPDLPISLEVPMHSRAQLSAVERAKLLRSAAERVLQRTYGTALESARA